MSPPGISLSLTKKATGIWKTSSPACHRKAFWSMRGWNCRTSARRFGTSIRNGGEKTAVLQDAQLDWRKLMNLTNRDCFRAVVARRENADRALRLGRRQPGRAVFRIARRGGEPGPVYTHERRCAPSREGSAGFDPLELFGARKDALRCALFSIFGPSWLGACSRTGWLRSALCAVSGRTWIWR